MGTCTGLWALFLVAMVAVLPLALSTNSKYIVTAPSKARRGYPYTVNVALLLPAGSPSTVEASVLDLSNKVEVGPVPANFVGDVANEQKVITLSIPTTLTAGKYYLKVESKSGVVFRVKEDLQVLSETGLIMIQTDKKVYKEGQTVHIRGAVLSSAAKPLDTNLDVIIADPDANKLAHYKGLTPDHGVVSVDFDIVNDPTFGEWSITIMATNTPGIVTEKKFSVEKYVLPKFSVAATLPPFIQMFGEQSTGIITVDVVAKYTYGKPVNGKAMLLVNIGSDSQMEENTLVNGMVSFTTTVSQKQVAGLRYMYKPEASVRVSVVEDVTGKEEVFEGSVPLHVIPYKISFINDDGSFIYGMPNNIFVKVTDAVGGSIPLADRAALGLKMNFRLSARWAANTELLPALDLTMPETGDVVSVQVDVPTKVQMENQTFSMEAELTYPSMDNNPTRKTVKTGFRYKNPVATKTSLGISVSVVGITQQVKSPETAVPAGQAVTFRVTTTVSSAVFYEVHAKGLLLANGTVSPAQTNTGLYTTNFDVTITPKMAPNAVVVVYANTATDEIVADAQIFSVSGLLKHRLSARFDSNLKRVGDTASLTVEADPNSVVFVGAIDKSAALLGEPNKIDLDGLLEALEDFDLIAKSSEGNTDWGCGGCGIMFKRKRRDVEMVQSQSGVTTSSILRDAGVIMVTDSVITDSEWNRFPVFAENEMVAIAGAVAPEADIVQKSSGSGADLDSKANVRKHFPETWIWTDIRIGSSGSSTSDFPVPDTITSWDIDAFSMNTNTGIDLALNLPSLTVMKEMFVSLDFPLTVKRGEKFKLNIYVFNYFNSPLTADVTLDAPLAESFGVFPLEYSKEILEDESQARPVAVTKTGLRVPSNSSAGFFLWIYPKVIGNIKLRVRAVSPMKTDIMEQSVLVEPEGKTRYGASSMSIKHDVDKTAEFVMQALPDEGATVVEGSKSNYITFTGDVMGPTIENLDSLVRQPCGCGEQNMITLVPNIFVRKYVEAVKDFIDQTFIDRTNDYMKNGYQKELRYKHPDWSYSAFGTSDNSGSSWLTAFVVKSFAMSKPYIPVTVDEEGIAKSMTWLLGQLDDKFFFGEPGRVIHTEMKGGSTSNLTRTAYIYISLKEAQTALPGLNVPNLDNKLSQVLKALEDDYSQNKNDLSKDDKKFIRLAILAYAFALGDSSLTSDVIQTLEDLAQDQDGMLYWSAKTESAYKDNGRVYCRLPSKPSDVETAAYAILAYTKLGNQAQGRRVLKWLMSQMSDAGSFHSTQDTVMGLQAIAEISILIKEGSAGMNLAVEYTVGAVTNTLTINDDNKYLLQKEKLPDDTTDVTFRITGKGEALLSLLWKYNVLANPQNNRPKFNIETNTYAVNTNTFDATMTIELLDRNVAGQMALVGFNAPSGFITDIDQIKGASRVENIGGRVAIYIAGIETGKTQFRLQSTRIKDVADIMDGTVTAELYYDPDSSSLATYELPDMLKLTACQLSGDMNDECPLPRDPSGASAATPTKLLLGLVSVLLLLTNLN